jgi:hypothetical protein
MKKIYPNVIITIPPWARVKIKEIALKRGLPFATTIRSLLCEKLNELK